MLWDNLRGSTNQKILLMPAEQLDGGNHVALEYTMAREATPLPDADVPKLDLDERANNGQGRYGTDVKSFAGIKCALPALTSRM
jgi:hypothetical protein